MFDVQPQELLVLGAVALLVIPPKDLPKAMRMAGYWMGRARGVARQFRSGFDTMIRDAELQEMEKKWAAENERIMREHPPTPAALPETTLIEHQAAEPAEPVIEVADAHDESPPVMVEKPAVAAVSPPAADHGPATETPHP